MLRHPKSTLFPYTTLFRSARRGPAMSRPPVIPPDDVPEPDAEPTSAEKAQARAFGELLDKALAGRTPPAMAADDRELLEVDRKSTRLNSSHSQISYAVFCL